ncbi:hypothetical protein NA643_19070 [Pseudomonas stutzeri]|uniref:hypothetical protein n=1 Tax=Stutzerimonas stutzeri TaxID=316 RepID=UPI0011AEF83B|nr:hypothetical protein [Stutzerimonas stutzeri]MCQ4281184.1 hypothetical protein [Stutzerimonas stutzeri]
MNSFDNVFTGVFSGIVTTIILYFCALFTQKVVGPWITKLRYSGVDLSGKWYCADCTMAQEITFDLTQSANVIHGKAQFHTKSRKPNASYEDIRSFSIEGRIEDRFVSLFLKHEDRQRLGINNYLLEVVGDGRHLKGVFCFYGLKNHTIMSSQQNLWRDKASAHEDYLDNRQQLFDQSSKILAFSGNPSVDTEPDDDIPF